MVPGDDCLALEISFELLKNATKIEIHYGSYQHLTM